MLWYITLANVFVYLLRYSVLDWAPTYLKEAKSYTVDHFGWDGFRAAGGRLPAGDGFPRPDATTQTSRQSGPRSTRLIGL